MAVEVEKKVRRPRSTGKVTTPVGPVESEQTVDNTSTDAVAYQSPGEHVVEHYDAEVVVSYPTPGPVTMTVSGLGYGDDEDEEVSAVEVETKGAPAGTETKVVEPPPAPEPKHSAVEPETK